MKRIFHIAWREFMATVATRGFLVGVLMTPALIGMMILVLPRLMNEKSPRVVGEIAIQDPTGELTQAVRDYLAPAAIAARREAERKELEAKAPGVAAATQANPVARQALEAALGEVPQLTIVDLPAAADLEVEKKPLTQPLLQDGKGRLAVVVLHPNAIAPDVAKPGFGKFDLFVRAKLDDRIESDIQEALKHAIVEARVRIAGFDRARIEALTRVGQVRSITVTTEGEQKTNEAFNILLPAGFMVLMLVSVLTSGQYLMTTVIEEKSSRVVEVLLSAVSPMQLMTGKILGQMGVGLVIMILYAGLGLSALLSFALMGLVDAKLFVFLIAFFLIAYFVIASLMAGIGAAVNEMREAQTLMTPLMILIMIPWMLWMPITRNPNSMFSTVISFIPPINSFAMLLRLTSTSPPPLWQVFASMAIGILSVWGALWFATKVFRIGLLMFGKPPNLATLIRWARMA
jgi:ABC-type Na+ efflux pump permease subunit